MRGANRSRVQIERRLRQQSTDAETILWLSLRDRRLGGYKFVRQEAIENFIVDFVCRDRKLIIEVDGGQHADSTEDRRRDDRLAEAGYRVARFWNGDVLANKDGVLQTILAALKESEK